MSTTLLDLHVPGLGESITEARIAKWVKADGQMVTPDDVVAELETDKASVELPAGGSGILHIVKAKGQTVNVGDLIAQIDTSAKAAATSAPAPAEAKSAVKTSGVSTTAPNGSKDDRPLSPSVQRLTAENGIDVTRVPPTGPGNRITKGDVLQYIESNAGSRGAPAADVAATQTSRESRGAPAAASPRSSAAPALPADLSGQPEETRVEMSRLRETVARRLVEAQHTAAILTTFNEIDMSAVMALREKYKDRFEKHHGVGLGFMSFFARAACAAIKAVPAVNAQIQDRTIVYKNNVHLSVAVSTEKGLIVPVVRYANRLSMAQIENEIKRLATRAREGKISLEELGGGTFTITNGGVFGSLLSTPILNPPQSAILGLHKIEKRAVVVNDQIVVRPMMYVALSYDHRLIDGQQAVTFLVHVKESLEDPARLLLDV
ncbi:MAG: 2-oxoglutarate dehydrogenase complex dihydrolipoyllysine-residue succinyltransferase [Phycisphaerales bacterium]|nr:2-oxoglutarate dehydrogenase complex dihydrolipoyllysine-residue succinyltransferase [Phycisphaerales bacterium]